MSVAIISISSVAAIVATDSRMGKPPQSHENMPKVYAFGPHLAFYGVGNAGITAGLLTHVKYLSEKEHIQLDYNDSIQLINEWKQYIENEPDYNGIWGFVGACGQNGDHYEATTILVDADNHESYLYKVQPFGNSAGLEILPPSDFSKENIYQIINNYTPYIGTPPTQSDMISLCEKTIRDVANQSAYVNKKIQYWSIDIPHDRCKLLLRGRFPKSRRDLSE